MTAQRLFQICLFVAATVFITPQVARADGQVGAIQSVIESQISAFQDNDLPTAFGFAAPSIQRQFGTPEMFGQMVRRGYPMVWRPRSHSMGQLVETEVGPVQVVVFEDSTGRLFEAGYLMKMVDGAWRIAGVKLRALPGAGA